ncbi:MAG: hypothetical protein HYZ58_03915 [Acidobacteria bacterium]|nr:hypothetical protein [Acidobacteriota bacterium]MBI3262282.1 hypothetical protein [Acidobacteriota bacterium]
MEHHTAIVDQHSSAQAKIALFRSFFRGRDDVYPRRFESRKTGKSGYAPACANEWVRGVCEKPRIKCAECPHRRFLPVTDTMIRCHLSGQDDEGEPFVAGVYPMLLDETCFFLAVDFDKHRWCDDARAFLETCRRVGVPAALERSRSGRGGQGTDARYRIPMMRISAATFVIAFAISPVLGTQDVAFDRSVLKSGVEVIPVTIRVHAGLAFLDKPFAAAIIGAER